MSKKHSFKLRHLYRKPCYDLPVVETLEDLSRNTQADLGVFAKVINFNSDALRKEIDILKKKVVGTRIAMVVGGLIAYGKISKLETKIEQMEREQKEK